MTNVISADKLSLTFETREGHGEFVKRDANATVNRALSKWKELTAPRPVERSSIPARKGGVRT